jgi:hypothetical protein
MTDTPQVLLQHHLKKLRLADLQQRVRQAGMAMRGGEQGPCSLPAAAL